MNTLMPILAKTNFETTYKTLIEYKVENAVVLVNPLNVSWVLLTLDEYGIYRQLANSSIDDEARAQNIMMKLVVNNLVRFKNNTANSSFIKPKTNVYYAPTPYCNLRCVYCYAEAQPPTTSVAVSADTEQSYRLIDNMISSDVETVHFTGGEPTLRKDIFELVSYVKSKGLKAGILTNGTNVTEKTASQYKAFDRVTISLDASKAELNDITRGKGTFDRIVSAIKSLKRHGINVSVTSVISTVNLDNVPDLLRFVRDDLGVISHKVSLYVSHGRGKENADSMELSYDEIISFRATYIDFLIQSNTEGNVISLLQPQLQQGMKRLVCGVASSEIFVDYEGNVYPCRLFEDSDHILGNISNTPLSEVMENTATKRFQSQLCVDNITDCKDCEVRCLCGGGCRSSHSCYTGDINKSDKTLCAVIKHDIKSAVLLNVGYNPFTMKKI